MFSLGNRCAAALCVLLLAGCAKREIAASIPPEPGPIHTQYAMRYIDVAIGTGKLAEAGKVFSVHYTGWLLDGTKFDSSRDRGAPLSFEQGKRKVIPGWDAGFEGMRVGGKRRLFYPLSTGIRRKGTRKDSSQSRVNFRCGADGRSGRATGGSNEVACGSAGKAAIRMREEPMWPAQGRRP